MDLVLFGIQGSGKGTLGKKIATKYDFTIFETGAELRKFSDEDSPLGKKVKSIVESGNLVPNEVVIDIIENFMTHLEPNKKVLFDGIPRQMEQAQTFDKLMQKLNRNFMGILIELPEEEAIKRLLGRRICQKCKHAYPLNYSKQECEKCGGELITRKDDNEESIKTRLNAFFQETIPVIEHYKSQDKIKIMNGNQSMEDAEQEAFKIIGKII